MRFMNFYIGLNSAGCGFPNPLTKEITHNYCEICHLCKLLPNVSMVLELTVVNLTINYLVSFIGGIL